PAQGTAGAAARGQGRRAARHRADGRHQAHALRPQTRRADGSGGEGHARAARAAQEAGGVAATYIWISKELVLAVHERQLAEHGGSSGVRDGTLLESALARP